MSLIRLQNKLIKPQHRLQTTLIANCMALPLPNTQSSDIPHIRIPFKYRKIYGKLRDKFLRRRETPKLRGPFPLPQIPRAHGHASQPDAGGSPLSIIDGTPTVPPSPPNELDQTYMRAPSHAEQFNQVTAANKDDIFGRLDDNSPSQAKLSGHAPSNLTTPVTQLVQAPPSDATDAELEKQDSIAPWQEEALVLIADDARHELTLDAEQSGETASSVVDNACRKVYGPTPTSTQRVELSQGDPSAVDRAVSCTLSDTPLTNSTMSAPGWRGIAYEGFKTSLDILVNVSAPFPPLKVAAGGLRSVLTIIDVGTPPSQIIARISAKQERDRELTKIRKILMIWRNTSTPSYRSSIVTMELIVSAH